MIKIKYKNRLKAAIEKAGQRVEILKDGEKENLFFSASIQPAEMSKEESVENFGRSNGLKYKLYAVGSVAESLSVGDILYCEAPIKRYFRTERVEVFSFDGEKIYVQAIATLLEEEKQD